MKKISKIFKPKTFGILLMMFVVATVVVNVQASGLGSELSDYQNQEEVLSKRIEDLENDLVLLSSISDKLERTEELGLSKPSGVYYLKLPEIFASR